MIEITADMEAIIKQSILSFVATINEDGTPNISPKASLALKNGVLFFADIASPQTIMNLKRNPAIEINVVDILQRRGYRFKGKALIVSPGDDEYSVFVDWVRTTNGPEYLVDHVVKIEATSITPLLVPAFVFNDPCRSQEQLLPNARCEIHRGIDTELAQKENQPATCNSGATIRISGEFHAISRDQNH